MKKTLFIFIVTMVFASQQLHAGVGDLINIQLGGSPTYTNGAAINDISSQRWNKGAGAEEPDAVDLQFSDRTYGSVYYTYRVSGSAGSLDFATSINTLDKKLFQGYLFTDSENTGLFVITGLDAGTYELYVYSQKETGASSVLSFTANGVSGYLQNDGTLTQLTEGEHGNYLVRNVVVGSDGELSIEIGASNAINGIQLLQTSTAPEPASMVLLGVGGVLAAVAKSRRTPGDVSDAVS